jgi:hypothetical protein
MSMVVNRERFLLLVGALASCHEAREVRGVTLSTVPAPPTRGPTFCESLAKENAVVLAHPEAPSEESPCKAPEERRKFKDFARNGAKRDPLLSYCHGQRSVGGGPRLGQRRRPGRRGAWLWLGGDVQVGSPARSAEG